MMKIPCDAPQCRELFDSTLELKMHRLESHYQYFFELSNGNEKLLERYMGVLK